MLFSRIFEPCVYWCFGHLPHVCLCNGVLGFQIGAWMRWLCFHVPCPCIKLCLFQRISYNFWLDRSFWKHRECLSVSDGWIWTLILLVFFVHMLILTVCRWNDIKSLLLIPGWAWWVWLICCWSMFLYLQVWMFISFILPGFANEEGNLQHICHISSSYLVSDNAWTSAFEFVVAVK